MPHRFIWQAAKVEPVPRRTGRPRLYGVWAFVWLVLSFPLPVFAQSPSSETVRIHLKWRHQFQFAGYYAAIEQGYYAQEGLDVTLLERKATDSVFQSVLDGRAEYGVADAGLILERHFGRPVTLVAQIFQHSPLILIALRESGISTPNDLIGRRVMIDSRNHSNSAYLGMLLQSGINPDRFTQIPHSMNPQSLVDGECDVMSAYLTDQTFFFKEQDIPINLINPQNYGVDFYGDNLFTTDFEWLNRPERVRAMREATIRGWAYALNNKDAIIDLIQKKYQSRYSRAHLEHEARMTELMILPDLYPIGSVNLNRFERIAETYAAVGAMCEPVIPNGFYVQSPQQLNKVGLNQEERSWLRTYPVVSLTLDSTAPPYAFIGENGQVEGIVPDILTQIQELLDIRFVLDPVSYASLLNRITSGTCDVGTLNDPLDVDYSDHYFKGPDYLFMPYSLFSYTKADGPILDPENLEGRTIALIRGWKLDNPGLAPLKGARFVFGETHLECINLILSGRADGIYENYAMVNYFLRENNIQDIRVVRIYGQGYPGAFFTRKDRPLLHQALSKALAAIGKDQINQIQRQWTESFDNLTYRFQSIALTDVERRWLQNHPVVRVATDPGWAPIEFRGRDGEYHGISIEYLRIIESMLGIEFQTVEANNFRELHTRARAREVDMFTCLAQTKNKQEFLQFTRPYISFPTAVFARADSSFVSNLTDLNGTRVAVQESTMIHENVSSDYPEINLIPLPDTDECVRALVLGQVDALICNSLNAHYSIQKLGYTNVKFVGDSPYVYDQSMAVRSDWPLLTQIIDKALATIPESDRNAIRRKWQIQQPVRPFDPTRLYQSLVVLGLLVLVVFMWNRNLRAIVSKRTAELTRVNNDLMIEIEEREKMASHLRRSEEKFRTLYDQAGDAIYLIRMNGQIASVNKQGCALLGYSESTLLAMNIAEIDERYADAADATEKLNELNAEGSYLVESRLKDCQNNPIPVELRMGLLESDDEPYALTIARDLRPRQAMEEERKRLEQQLRQAQKMEAIGQLTGGIAHDFNNLLQVINGNADLALMELSSDAPARKSLRQVSKAGDRAAKLIKQLLTFSRRQHMESENLNLNMTVAETLKMLRRVIGEHIVLKFNPGDQLWSIHADRSMIDQILMNLSVNARDAMPNGGTLTIETSNKIIDREFKASHPWAHIGAYVVLSISDTGHGMDEQTRERVYEPFFTTKELGKGTGLGLATVYGIVRQHNGFIHLYSELNIGTRFRIYFPVTEQTSTSKKARPITPLPVEGSGTILLAEDEEMVRQVTEQILTQAGYHVLVAQDGVEAVRLFLAHQDAIRLILSDIVMPNLNGWHAIEKIREHGGEMPVILSTGYNENIVEYDGSLKEQVSYIQKPYSRHQLLEMVRSVLQRT